MTTSPDSVTYTQRIDHLLPPFVPPVYSLDMSNAWGDGVTDDAAAINLYLASLPTGSRVMLPAGHKYLISSANLSVPAGVILEGTTLPLSKATASSLSCNALVVATNRTISMGAASGLRNVLVYQQGLPTAPTDAQAATELATWTTNGVGITVSNDGVMLTDLLVLGFQTGIKVRAGRFYANNLWLDNYVCFDMASAADNSYVNGVHCEPFWSLQTVSSASGGWARPGAAFYHGPGTTGCFMDECFAFMFANGLIMDSTGVFVTNFGTEWQDSLGNGTINTVGIRYMGSGGSGTLRDSYIAGQSHRCISVEQTGVTDIGGIELYGTYNTAGIYCMGQTAATTTVTVGGTHTAGDTVTITITSADLNGGVAIPLTYTVVSGDTNATIVAALTRLINLKQVLVTGKVHASESSPTVVVRSCIDLAAVGVVPSKTGTTTVSSSSTAAQLGTYGLINGFSGPSQTIPLMVFGDTGASTNYWTVSNIFNLPTSATFDGWISAPFGAEQGARISLSAIPHPERTGNISFGGQTCACVGTDEAGHVTIGAAATTTGTFLFAQHTPWTPTSVVVTMSDPTITVGVTAVTTASFSLAFSANAANKTFYYRVSY